MKALLTSALIFLGTFAYSQQAFLFGEIIDSDSTRIEIWHNGEKLMDYWLTDVFYSLQLGEREHYTIKFTSEGRHKYMHLINVGQRVEKIETDIDFRRYEHAIVWKKRFNERGLIMDIYRTKSIIGKAKF